MLPPAGVAKKQEEFVMPLQVILCLCSGNVPGSFGLPEYLTEKETRNDLNHGKLLERGVNHECWKY